MIEKTALDNEVEEHKRSGLYKTSSDSTQNNFKEPNEGSDMQSIIDEYKTVNQVFIQAMDFILDMVSRNELTDADFQLIHQLDFYYQKREMNSRDAMNMDKGIFTTILHGTLSETFEKSLLFFGNNDAHKWNLKQDEYKAFFIKLGGFHFRAMIQVVDKLYSNLKELYFDYKGNDNRFDRYFNFEEFTEKGDEIVDLNDRKNFFIQTIHDCNKLCSSKRYFDSYGNECLTFISKCKKAIEIIDTELDIKKSEESNTTMNQSGSPKFRLVAKKKTDFIKIVSAMYDNRMFETGGGYLATNKQELMNEFGRIVGEDLSKYSSFLSLAKKAEKQTFMKTFKDIELKAEEYYDKELEK
jgi:hypothetical protein